MLSTLIDTSNWTHEQWLTASILVFVVLAAVLILHRMLKIFQMSRRQPYQPNLRPLRRRRHHLSEQNTKPSENDSVED